MIREIIKVTDGYVHIPIPKEYLNEELEVIIFRTDEGSLKNSKNNNLLQEFDMISQNISTINKDIDILKLDEDMNSDIF